MQRNFLTLATATAFTVTSAATVLAADIARRSTRRHHRWHRCQRCTVGPDFMLAFTPVETWADTDWFYPCSATNLLIASPCNLASGGHSGSSWLAGGQVGFNYQVGRWVWGIEAEFSGTEIKGSNLDAAFPTQEFLHSRTDFIGTVAPRVGVAWDRTLLYVKGGAAWTHDKY